MSSIIKAEKVRKTYENGFEALKSIDLEIQKSTFFTLLGPNGAGKSTLVKLMSGLLISDSGEILIDNFKPIRDFNAIQRIIGVSSQDNELDPGENASSLLTFQGRLFGMSKSQAKARAEELIKLFFLEEEAKKKVENLSGGNKRKLHCALSLVHKPQILFLDEPTVGMDPLVRDNFWQVIHQLNQESGVTVFLTTQYLEEADKYASEMALIIQGNIHYSGTVSNFKQKMHPEQNLSLEESYLKYVKSLEN